MLESSTSTKNVVKESAPGQEEEPETILIDRCTYRYLTPDIRNSALYTDTSTTMNHTAEAALNRNDVNRELKQTTMTTATTTPPNKRYNEQNNGCARAL